MRGPKLVRVVIDPETTAKGAYAVGGDIRVIACPDDATLGRELRTKRVVCHDEEDAAVLREVVEADPLLDFAEEVHDAVA